MERQGQQGVLKDSRVSRNFLPKHINLKGKKASCAPPTPGMVEEHPGVHGPLGCSDCQPSRQGVLEAAQHLRRSMERGQEKRKMHVLPIPTFPRSPVSIWSFSTRDPPGVHGALVSRTPLPTCLAHLADGHLLRTGPRQGLSALSLAIGAKPGSEAALGTPKSGSQTHTSAHAGVAAPHLTGKRLERRPCHSPAVWPWASYLASLCLSFFPGQMGIV